MAAWFNDPTMMSNVSYVASALLGIGGFLLALIPEITAKNPKHTWLRVLIAAFFLLVATTAVCMTLLANSLTERQSEIDKQTLKGQITRLNSKVNHLNNSLIAETKQHTVIITALSEISRPTVRAQSTPLLVNAKAPAHRLETPATPALLATHHAILAPTPSASAAPPIPNAPGTPEPSSMVSLSVFAASVPTSDKGYPYRESLTVTTDKEMNPISLAVIFDSGSLDGNAFVEAGVNAPSSISELRRTWVGRDGVGHPLMVLKVGSSVPPFSPQNPLTIIVQSKEPIGQAHVVPIPYNGPP